MATTWGNYTDYSGLAKAAGASTHVVDPRLATLAALVPGVFTAKHCFDIGCNAGSVSCQLAFDFHAASVTGVDIDPKLVAQAHKLLALRTSRAQPPSNGADPTIDYFPISAVLSHGYRVEPATPSLTGPTAASTIPSSQLPWPHVSFFPADWITTTEPLLSGPYDVILALSVIKWIHLEHLDQGLETFFRKCSTSLVPGGHLIIELQGWDSYEKAIRPNHAPHFIENFKALKYRPETSFAKLLADEGFVLCASADVLPRRISVYRKANA